MRVFDNHQIARMVVAMHVYTGLGKIVGEDALEHLFQLGLLFVVERYAQMFGDIPLGEQVQFAAQQRFVVERKFILFRGELYFDECISSGAVESGGVFCSQRLQIGDIAQVGQQQEALRQILRVDMWHVGSCVFKQLAHMDKGFAVFVLRRGIHYDLGRPVGEGGAEVSTEAGIGRCGGDCEGFVRIEARKPVGKLLLTLHLIALMVVLCDFSTLIYLPRTMPFRFSPIAFLLLGLFPPFGHAEDAPLPLKLDRTFRRNPVAAEGAAAFINARHVEAKKDDQLEATGDVELRQNGQVVKADHLLYGQESKDVLAEGAVQLEQPGLLVTGPLLKLNLDTDVGEMSLPKYEFSENHARGTAEVMHIEGKKNYTFDDATYTTCPAGERRLVVAHEPAGYRPQ